MLKPGDKVVMNDRYVSNRLSDKNAFPAADVAPVRRGRWIQGNGYVECSECHTIGSPHWKCCQVCTARMDLEEA